jgi:hypothetical protein
MQRDIRLAAVAAALLWAGPAAARGWQGYFALGAGVALDHLSEWDARGAALQGYLGVETPVSLSLGVVVEGAETWGRKVGEVSQQASVDAEKRVQFDYRSLGLEVRLRFFRERMLNPWVGARIAVSRSAPLTPDESGQLVRQSFESTSKAVRVGLDAWLGESWGLSASTSLQWCDLISRENSTGGSEVTVRLGCNRPLQTILLGPTLRF